VEADVPAAESASRESRHKHPCEGKSFARVFLYCGEPILVIHSK
jgi:hypothetical protein